MIKVLLAAPFDGIPGGIMRWANHLIAYYESVKTDCQIISFSLGRSNFININQSVIYRIWFALKDYSVIYANFKRIIKSNELDIVHITSSASLSLIKDNLMIRVAHRRGVKTIVHFHFGRIPVLCNRNNWEWKLLIKIVKMSDGVIVLDNQSYETLIKKGFKNVFKLPNPVAPSIFDIINRNKFIKREPNTILFVGHIVKTKGIYELITACKNVPEVKIKMIGHVTDKVRAELLDLFQSPYNNQLDIIGELAYEEVIKEMLKCDLFVLPTYTEGFPNVILESMACGCAIITTKVGAIPEMLEEETGNCYGLMVEPKNTVQLKRAIETMLNDVVFKEECRQNVKKRVFERYNISSVWRQLINVWSEIF